jgi:hypothetical protein
MLIFMMTANTKASPLHWLESLALAGMTGVIADYSFTCHRFAFGPFKRFKISENGTDFPTFQTVSRGHFLQRYFPPSPFGFVS